MAEGKRHKLKPKQWQALVAQSARLNAAVAQLEQEKQRAAVESDLILEALGLDPATKVELDPETQELVEVVEADTQKRRGK